MPLHAGAIVRLSRVADDRLGAFREGMHMGEDAGAGGNEANGLHSYKLYAPPLRADVIGRTSILNHVFGGEPSEIEIRKNAECGNARAIEKNVKPRIEQ